MTLDSHHHQSGAASPHPPQRPKRRRTLFLIASLLVLLIAGGIAWYLLSPLFFHMTRHDANPFAQAPSAPSIPPPGSTPDTAPVPAGPVPLATGAFLDHIHAGTILAHERGSGKVTVGKTVDGQYLIHFDQLNITNGPDLHVYLAPTSHAIDAPQIMREGVDLGPLAATEGELNVTIPTDVSTNLKQYHSVVIVCKLASTVFTVAPLTFLSD